MTKITFHTAHVKSVAFVSPSVTPWLHEGGVNPSLRLYEYKEDGVHDYWQYYLNLSRIHLYGDTAANSTQWQLLYQATAAYGVSDLSVANVLQIYKDMLLDPAVFDRYYFHNTVGHVFKECDAACVRDHLCAMTHHLVGDMDNCQDGVHVLFRDDAHLSARFEQISRSAKLLKTPGWSSAVFFIALAVVCGIACSYLMVKCRQYRHKDRHFNLGYLPHLSLDKSKYTSINAEEA